MTVHGVPTSRWLNARRANAFYVLDGAWGVMIQNYRLSEADFRGKRFTDHSLPI